MLIIVTGNLLKSLGPNDKLVKAVGDLDILLRAETSIVISQMNRRTFETSETLRQMSSANIETRKHIIGIHQNIEKMSVQSNRLEERTFGMEEVLNRVEARVDVVGEGVLGLVSAHNDQPSISRFAIFSDTQGLTLEDLLESIYPHDFESQQKSFRAKRVPNSGRWFLNHEKFQASAYRSSNMTLWCPGLRIFFVRLDSQLQPGLERPL